MSECETWSGEICDEESSNASLSAKGCGYAYGAVMTDSLATTSKSTSKQRDNTHITVTTVSSLRFPVVISTTTTAAPPVAVPVAIPVTIPVPSITVVVSVPVTFPVALVVHVVFVLHVDVHFLFFCQHTTTNKERERERADCVGLKNTTNGSRNTKVAARSEFQIPSVI